MQNRRGETTEIRQVRSAQKAAQGLQGRINIKRCTILRRAQGRGCIYRYISQQQLLYLYFYMCVSSFQISLSMLDVTSSDTGRTRNLPAEGITGNCAFSLPEGGFYPQLIMCPQTVSFLIAPPLGVSQVLKIIFRPFVLKLLEGLKSRCSLISHQSFTHRSQLASTAALPLWTPDLF